jgi:hypothetical protein
MADVTAGPKPAKPLKIPPELINIGGTSAALLAVVAVGGWLSEMAPAGVWFTAASYGAPAAVAFTLYWLVSRRL